MLTGRNKIHILLVFFMALMVLSCGPSKEEIEAVEAQQKTKYRIGDIVYLKPDSCVALITDFSVGFWHNGKTDYDHPSVLYSIRDCHGLQVQTKDEFIYSLKSR